LEAELVIKEHSRIHGDLEDTEMVGGTGSKHLTNPMEKNRLQGINTLPFSLELS